MSERKVDRPLAWQLDDWHRLVELIERDRLPHALMLAGPAGLGKGHFAELVIARLLCAAPQQAAAGAVACGRCHGCSMRLAGHHPDLLTVAPADQGRLIRIDTVRGINDFLAQTAQQGGYRIVRLNGAEAMTIGAANALLKGLEEPGDRTLFLLLSDMPSRVMPTVLSRCQRWSFTAPSFDDCLPWLVERLADEDDARFWWRVAGGMPLAAVAQGESEARKLRQRLTELFDALVRGAEPVAEAARLDRQQLGAILGYGISWLEDLIRLGLSGNVESLRNPDLLSLYRQAVKNARVRDWFRLLDYAREQRRLIAQGGNPNPQLVLEAWLIRWAALLRS
ncbi:DNA polymerase III subunit delta' [Halotalea alkalilenta]|uniref:DNA polymerase III subunit delta' n=1 Tax=Halotalea alkalilenta TaxID=376489 RepID=UPI000487ED20|nr:DNA polymerase III subunit delta' [Halotalea alkalilenta]